MKYFIILLLSLLIINVNKSYNQEDYNLVCNSNVNPFKPEDCYNLSKENVRCCYLKIYSVNNTVETINNIATSIKSSNLIVNRCYTINNYTTSAIVDTYQYNVLCNEINTEYDKYYLQYSKCGESNINSKNDCFKHSQENNKCCYSFFGGERHCYYLGNVINNIIVHSGLVFNCYSKILKLYNVYTILILILLEKLLLYN